MAFLYGAILAFCAILDRHYGDGPIASDIEMSASLICFAIATLARKDANHEH